MPLGPPSGPQVLSRTPETMEWLRASVAKSPAVKKNIKTSGEPGLAGALGRISRSGPTMSRHVSPEPPGSIPGSGSDGT